MAEGVRVIMELHDIFDEYEDIDEAFDDLGKEKFCRKVHEAAKYTMMYNFPGAVDSVSDLDTSDLKDDWLLGVERPDGIIGVAEKWNINLMERLKARLEPFEKLKEKWHKSDLFSVFEALEHGEKEDGFHYDTALYNLRKSLAELDGHFDYACYGIVIMEEIFGYSFSTKLGNAEKQSMIEHPESYAVFWMYYE